ATDPANPYGATLKWPRAHTADRARPPSRSVGATVVLVDGSLVAYVARGDRQLTTFLPEAEPARSRAARALARVLMARATEDIAPRGALVEEIDGAPPDHHPLTPFLVDAGYAVTAHGLQARPSAVSHRVSPFGSRPADGGHEAGVNGPPSLTESDQSPAVSRRRRTGGAVSSPFAPRYYGDETEE